jgi:hypothetical protein
MRRLTTAIVLLVATVTAHADPNCREVPISEPHPGRLDLMLGANSWVYRDLAVSGSSLVWSAGESLWRMPADGRGCLEMLASRPKSQANLVDSLRIATGGDGVQIARGAARDQTPVGALPETPQTFLVQDGFLYTTVWRGDTIYRLDLATGLIDPFVTLPKDSGHFGFMLAKHGDKLFAASYGHRTLVEIPFATGKPRTIARGLASGPTALVVDDTHAFLYLENSRKSKGALVAIALSTGKSRVLAKDLVNSDSLLLDGNWLYLRHYANAMRGSIELVRVPSDGSGGVEIVETALPSPARPIAIDADAIYIDGGSRIVRLDKRQLATKPR